MITVKDMMETWAKASGASVVTKYEDCPISSQRGWDAITALANNQPVVPRMIHEAFWKTYYQWADGLEKVLKSEQLGDVADIRLATEYREACKRMDIVAANYAIAPGPGSAWTVVAKQAAIPERK